jgi:hypothetical protein
MKTSLLVAAALLLPAVPVVAAAPAAQSGKADDNDGTDPTRPASQIRLSYDRQDFPAGFASTWVVRPKVQLGRIDGPGVDRGLGFGDASFKLTRIIERNRKFGVVGSVEIVAPTGNDRIGGGKWVIKPNLVYAMFLKGGHIFAPAVVHSFSIGGKAGLPPVNQTTLDFYVVPRLSNKNLFMTIDPALNFDWENNREFAALAVTMGYKLGPMLGGRGQISVKPSVGIGRESPFDYGVQLAFQLLGL